jgi:hypothetical protein
MPLKIIIIIIMSNYCFTGITDKSTPRKHYINDCFEETLTKIKKNV